MALFVQRGLVENKTLLLPQPPYSPDISPAIFFMFQNWKMVQNDVSLCEEKKCKKTARTADPSSFESCVECWEK